MDIVPVAPPINEASTSRRAKECKIVGCTTLSRGANRLCIRHGGGKRCQTCGKSAAGRTPFCRAHGGGIRCQSPFCKRFVPMGSLYCEGHIGGAHIAPVGAGNRCEADGCDAETVGRSKYCDLHRLRCHHPGCTKYRQGGTKKCRAHGKLQAAPTRPEALAVVPAERRRCEWAQLVLAFGKRAVAPCPNFAAENEQLCIEHAKKILGRKPRS